MSETRLLAPVLPGAGARIWRPWIRIEQPREGGTVKVNKAPCDENRRAMKDWQKSAFMTLDEALAVGAAGVGHVQGQGYTGLDLDHCLDEDGNVLPEAKNLVASSQREGAYVEVSPGGRGLHIIGRGFRDAYEIKFPFKDGDRGHDLPGRFLTVTGAVYGEGRGDPEMQIDGLMERIEAVYPRPPKKPAAKKAGGKVSRAELIDALKERDLFPSERLGDVDCRCPWSYEAGDGPTDTGFTFDSEGLVAGFHCFHPGCSAKTLKDGLAFLGFEKKKHNSQSTKLIDLAWGLDLFRSPAGEAYAVVPVGEAMETLPLGERAFRNWMAARFYDANKSGTTGQAIHDAVMTLAGETAQRGSVRDIHVRVAASAERVVLDLGRDDRKTLVIDAAGWRVAEAPEGVHLIRRPGMLGLPDPARNGKSLDDNLREIMNVKDGDNLMMLTAWLVAALRGRRPFPILTVKGEQGSAKSSGCRAVRSIIDPSQAALSMAPKEPRDMVITAGNSYVLGFDNLSFISDWLSDALSALATGAGFRTRALTTDKEETIFEAARPVILNGIPDLLRRGDLADRALVVELEPIEDEDRKTASEIDQKFKDARGAILASLADAVSQAILKPVQPDRLPRMADFACVAESAAPALGWEPGAFSRAYGEVREETSANLLEGDPVAQAIDAMRDQGDFVGSLDALLIRLRPLSQGADLPKNARGLGEKLKRIAPALRLRGIKYQPPSRKRDGQGGRGRVAQVCFEGGRDTTGRVHSTKIREVGCREGAEGGADLHIIAREDASLCVPGPGGSDDVPF